MLTIHLYPSPSDPCPIFMFGQFDLDDTDSGSPLALGEAMLSVQKQDKPHLRPPYPSPRRLRGSLVSRLLAAWHR
jgi:hypothetical protein